MTTPRESPTPIFLDCDTGIDDALALALPARRSGRRQPVGIGTVSGNINAVKAAENTLALLEVAGRTDIPVAVGALDPLVGRFGGGAPRVHGEDGVGGVALKPSVTKTVEADATTLLASLAAEWNGALRILAVGPLTNLAHFLDLYSEYEALIAEVIVMGGAFTAPGNVSGTAEANIFHDPELPLAFSTRVAADDSSPGHHHGARAHRRRAPEYRRHLWHAPADSGLDARLLSRRV